MAEVWVRLPLGALRIRTWGSRASRVPWEHENAGSIPAVLTDMIRCGQTVRRRPVKPMIGGSIPPTGALRERKGKPTGDGTPLEPGRAFSLLKLTYQLPKPLTVAAVVRCADALGKALRVRVGPLNIVLWPSGEGSSLTRRQSRVRVPPGLLRRCPDTPTGRAIRLKPASAAAEQCAGGTAARGS